MGNRDLLVAVLLGCVAVVLTATWSLIGMRAAGLFALASVFMSLRIFRRSPNEWKHAIAATVIACDFFVLLFFLLSFQHLSA